ncbi:hypothetical protein [Bacillus sp. RAR_GA_16]|uniref:hypothetical protein n=1 Tax=Bacillus sp. RAR_GA_16 TaxID=2876774 RepID=UPI001CCDBCEA|nr:hypothetical protein [Bacillus sp. RAR_GA_16]MCA0172960.1 hypothetical protein [Bacillus sp. RAR_GA_16]
MNVNRFARNIMAKDYDGERFLLHVAEVMERQLKEWDAAYEVVVMKLIDYEVVIKKENRSYELLLTEKDLLLLQQTSPYALESLFVAGIREAGASDCEREWGLY